MSTAPNAASETLSNLEFAKEGLIVLLGFNLPMIEELKARNLGHTIAVYDPDYMGEPYPGTWLLDGKDFSFFDKWHPQILNGQMLLICHNPTVTANPEPYEQFKLKLAEQKRLMECNIGTQVGLGKEFLGNFMVNIPVIMQHPGITKLKNLFPGVPAILINPGPSLATHVHHLKKALGCLLIATDAALPLLISEGIKPHFIVAVDPKNENKRFFTDYDFLKDSAFVCLAQYTPEVVRVYKGPLYFSCSPGSAIMLWLGRWMGEDRGYLPCDGGSVSHMALSLAEHLGCNPVAFLGLDLSWKDTFYAGGIGQALWEGKELITPADGIPATDVYGQPCRTQNSFDIFRICFENKLAVSPHITAMNCSDGIPIKGADHVPLERWLQVYANAYQEILLDFVMKMDLFKPVDIEPLRQEVMAAYNLFTQVLSKVKKAAELVELVDAAKKKKDARTMQARIEQLEKVAAKTRTPYLNLIAYFCYALELFMQRADCRDVGQIIDSNERLEKQIAFGREYYKHLGDGIRDFLVPLKELKDQLTQRR